jgi:PAS domain-containing protein
MKYAAYYQLNYEGLSGNDYISIMAVLQVEWSITSTPQTSIQPGDTVIWSNADGLTHTVTDGICTPGSSFDENCSPKLYNSPLLRAQGEKFQFTFYQCSVFDYYCEIHSNVMFGRVLVGNVSASSSLPTEDIRKWKMAHAFCMFFAFGIILPIGGYMAASARFKWHYILQISGLALSVAGYVLGYTYSGKFNGHFNHLHGYCGIVLLALAWGLQPITVYLGTYYTQFRHLHRRNGQILVFFGIANIFMGFTAYGPELNAGYRVGYGVWVGLTILGYILFLPSRTVKRSTQRRTKGATETPAAFQQHGSNWVMQDRDNVTESSVDELGLNASSMSREPSTQDLHLRALLEASTDAIVGADEKGNIVSWNAAAKDIFGYEESEVCSGSESFWVANLIRLWYLEPHLLNRNKIHLLLLITLTYVNVVTTGDALIPWRVQYSY